MNILVIDNNPVTLRQHECNLKKWGYNVSSNDNALDACSMLESTQTDIIVCDWGMPKMDDLDFCKIIRSKNFNQYIYFIIICPGNNHETIIQAMEAGADDYLVKPVCYDELRSRIDIGSRIVNFEKEALCRYEELEKNYYQTLRTFTSLIEVFSEKLGGHCRRVAGLSLMLAKRCTEIPVKEYRVIEAAALLHDIGMIGLPNKIFSSKRTELKDEEKNQYLSHPERGELILQEIEFLHPAAKIVRAHHEQYNGKGFPDGLQGDELPLHAQIVSAASIYDNLVNRGAINLGDIPGMLYKLSSYQLAPEIVNYLLEINMENIQKENRKDYLEISLDDLQNGMVLTRDVRMKTGAIIMPANTELTLYNIEKLRTYRTLKHFDHNVFILKSGLRPV
ncbi:MAG: response regulator [Desulfosarcina sp.]|nr:response regulator [Desulfobacterales bacterium]